MGFIDKVKKYVQNVLTTFKARKVFRIQVKDIPDLPAMLEKDRGMARGQLAAEQIRRQKAEQALIQKKKVDLKKELQKQQQAFLKEDLHGAFSLRNFFEWEKAFLGKKRGIKVMSYDRRRSFGDFHDFLISRKDGSIHILVDVNGKVVRLMRGPNARRVLRYGSLATDAKLGFIALNLDENGRYAENLEDTEVNNVVMDANGKLIISDVDTKPFMDLLIQKNEEISRVSEMLERSEKLHLKELHETRLANVAAQINKIRAELNSGLLSGVKGVAELHGVVDELRTDMAALALGKKIAEVQGDVFNNVMDTVNKKLLEVLPNDKREQTMYELKKEVDWLRHVSKPEKKEAVVVQEVGPPEFHAPVSMPKRVAAVGKG